MRAKIKHGCIFPSIQFSLFELASCLIEIPPADKILVAKYEEIYFSYEDLYFLPIFNWLNFKFENNKFPSLPPGSRVSVNNLYV